MYHWYQLVFFHRSVWIFRLQHTTSNLSTIPSYASCGTIWAMLYLCHDSTKFMKAWLCARCSIGCRKSGNRPRALYSARLCRLARPRIPLSRYSSEGPRPWSNARLCRFYKGGTPTKKTKGSQNLLNCIPFVSFLKRGPLGSAACSEGLKKGIIFPFHAQDVKIDSLLLNRRSLFAKRGKVT